METKVQAVEIVKRHDESAKYEGEPLFKAEQPYGYKYKYNLSQDENSDVKLSMLQKAGIVASDLIEYMKDIILFRENAFMFKTAEFTKRNWGRFTHYCS